MHDLGIPYGCIQTGEAFVFLHMPVDPTILQYYLCVPNKDVRAGDKSRLHQTAVGRMLAFTLQALAAEAPSQEWHDTADEQLSTWKVEYLDVLRHIPETIRREPPPSNYRPSHWKPLPKTHNTRSCARCNPEVSTPECSPSESSGSDKEPPAPSTALATCRSSRRKGNECQLTGGCEQVSRDRKKKEEPSQSNWHSMDPCEFTHKLHRQLVQDRNKGIEPLHIRGRTGYLLKATLLSHGYTVVIKATTKEKEHALKAEVDNYRRLRSLQGYQIPVCLGNFEPNIEYWYHGELMTHMMILSWSGIRLQRIINNENSAFLHGERNGCLSILRSHGVVHKDKEWRNILWDQFTRRLVVIDLEDMEWLKQPKQPKRPQPLQPTTGNLSQLSTKILFFSLMSFKERAGVGLLANDCGEGVLGHQILGRLLN
ncbi:hypothetical protein BJX63DRAFT_441397 [Aspergillus granulosus]|uniref:Protein kinase domain-containing protein n=1 Tax=Aspergillus granulosus TaxID=176169 RepID=A0ABR4GSR6_9EURO